MNKENLINKIAQEIRIMNLDYLDMLNPHESITGSKEIAEVALKVIEKYRK